MSSEGLAKKDQSSLENIQILTLHRQGASPEDIANILNKDPQIIALVIKSQVDKARKLSLVERYGDLKDIAILALKEVASTSENDSAKVAAAKCLIDEVDGNGGNGVGFDYNQLAERLVLAEKQLDEVAKVEVANTQVGKNKVVSMPKVTGELEFKVVNN